MPDSEDEVKIKVDQPNDPLLEKVKNYILATYEPVSSPGEANLRMTTADIYRAMQKLYNSPYYDEAFVANWLHEKGFTFFDAGSMRFEWLLKTTV